VTVAWRNTMGVLHPDEAHCELPMLSPAAAVAGNAALAPAAQAHRDALAAGVDAAVAATARRLVEAELAATQRRLRGIERHRIPMLENALRMLEFQLEELERQDRVVTRWAVKRRGANA